MDRTLNAEIEGRLMAVTARASRPLTEDELIQVRERIEQDMKHRDEMRALPLANGDAPVSDLTSPTAADGGLPW